MKKILIVGSGGREAAIVCSLAKNKNIEIYCFMSNKNPQIIKECKAYVIGDVCDEDMVCAFAKEFNIDIAYVSPDAALNKGISDALNEIKIKTASPKKICAKIEWDKAFSRNLMKKYNIDGQIKFKICENELEIENFIDENSEVAIKPIGLTGGKGVKVMGFQLKDKEEAKQYANELLQKDKKVIIEEKIFGEEFTLQVFSDGNTIKEMPIVQDHKRAYEGDIGPNTGGMGSYSFNDHLLPFLNIKEKEKALNILQKTIDAIKQETKNKYKGILYGQFMITKDKIKVIEFNSRFGDPECTNVLSILETDLFSIFLAIINENLKDIEVNFKKKSTVCKYLVPKGYPKKSITDRKIILKNEIDENKVKLYYASVYEKDNEIYTQKSRSIAVVGIDENIFKAEENSQTICESIKGDVWFRSDIGKEQLINEKINKMKKIKKEKK